MFHFFPEYLFQVFTDKMIIKEARTPWKSKKKAKKEKQFT